MRKFTQIFESAKTTDKQPGNTLLNTGVTNHYTPIENILTNVKNLFATRLGVVASIGEDNVSIKLNSTKFINDESIQSVLYEPLERFTSLGSYISAQGLTKITKVNLGMYYVVYFSPEDIKTAKDPILMEPNGKQSMSNGISGSQNWVANEMKNSLLDEFELTTIIKEDEAEEEIKNVTLEKVLELVDSKDKVKAAKQLELLVTQEVELPREFYFAGIKFKNGEEAIALRWKYTKKLPTGQTSENTRSIMHIFGKGDKAIWVQDFDKESIVQLPDEVKKLIESILDMLEANKTDDPAIFKLTGERKEREDKKDDKNDDKNDSSDNKEDNKEDNKSNDDDDEDDDSRGDNSDNA